MKKLIYLFLGLLIFACSSDSDTSNNDGVDNGGNDNNTNCEYVLNTLPVTDIEDAIAKFNGVISLDSNCEFPITEQGFVYAKTIQPTTANNKVNVNGTDVTKIIENLESNTTYYVRTFLTNVLGEFYGNEVSFMTNQCDGNNVIYLDSNGITIKACDYANVGDTGVINGVTYTLVDYGDLNSMITYGQDVSKVCTSLITNMQYLLGTSSLNQDINSWDVSNVTNMNGMFKGAPFNITNFNQDISAWDVSNVTDMSEMFGYSGINQDIGIGNWDVSSVTDMRDMFATSNFNQDIGNWDVSSVTNMNRMFRSSSLFNQDIGNWDVSNVTDMNWMFYEAFDFNQPIGNWDVSSVIDMDLMFWLAMSFNQPIENWDVINVTNMRGMFYKASSFNQPIGNWDVSSVTDMDTMFYLATSFNQDLSNWSVDNVIDCASFSHGTPIFQENLPNFTNCDD